MRYLILLFVIGQVSWAQNVQTSPFIEIIGTAEKKIIPNEIYIGIILKEKMDGRNKITIEEQEKLLFEQLKKQSISIEQLQLSDAISQEFIFRRKNNQLISQKEYELKVTTIEEVNRALDAFDAANIKSSYIVEMTHSNIEEYRKEVKILALQAAKDKATYLMESINQKVGNAIEVVEVSDVRASNVSPNFAYSNKLEESDHQINIKPITIKFSMKAKFEIK